MLPKGSKAYKTHFKMDVIHNKPESGEWGVQNIDWKNEEQGSCTRAKTLAIYIYIYNY
jgi:hypothetical protein